MLAASRKQEIRKIILKDKSVKVSEISKLFNVSEETIRRDLESLENEGVLERNYGGAIIVENNVPVHPLSVRYCENINEKKLIGKKAAELIRDGDIIIFDAGSTTLQIAKNIRSDKHLTVVTNDLNIAYELKNKSNAGVFVTGGKVSHDTMALQGPGTVKSIEGYNADITFLATSGITLKKGFTTSDIFASEVKKAMIRSAKKVVVVCDTSKIGRNALTTFAGISEASEIILAGKIGESTLEELNKIVPVILCE